MSPSARTVAGSRRVRRTRRRACGTWRVPPTLARCCVARISRCIRCFSAPARPRAISLRWATSRAHACLASPTRWRTRSCCAAGPSRSSSAWPSVPTASGSPRRVSETRSSCCGRPRIRAVRSMNCPCRAPRTLSPSAPTAAGWRRKVRTRALSACGALPTCRSRRSCCPRTSGEMSARYASARTAAGW
ncbi:hypothetical protein D9M68_593390 [compost metagenome]